MPTETDERAGRRQATVGEVIAPALDEDSLEAAEKMLKGFEDVCIEERDEVPQWVTAVVVVVSHTRHHWDLPVGGYRDG